MKKVLILGASSGIGKELALLFAKNQYQVAIAARRLNQLHLIQKQYPENILVQAIDATNDDAIHSLEELAHQLSAIDIFIFSSGIGALNPELDESKINMTNALNVNAFSSIITWVYHYFKKQGHGHIVVISSIAGLRGGRAAPSYNASKAYQLNFLEGLRQKAKKRMIILLSQTLDQAL